MIICVGCGHANGDRDAFCGSCGGFLEWEGQAVPQARAPVAVPASLVPAGPAAAPPGPPPGPPAGPATAVAQVEHARAPEQEHERPAPARPDPVDLGPADLYCGACGAGNATGRSFCRRCGRTLADAVTPAPRSWWRRLGDRLTRRRTLAAGERPASWDRTASSAGGGRRTKRRDWWPPRLPARLSLGKAAMPLAILSLAGIGLSPLRGQLTEAAFGAYHDARRQVAPHYVPVLPSGARASSAARGHDAAAAVDQNVLTWWAEGAPGRGRGQRLVVRFDRPTDLDRVTFHDGAAGAAYPFQPRLRVVRITLLGAAGVLDERRVPLRDTAKQQVVKVSGHAVTSVVVRVLGTYAGQKGAAASLAEVGFLSAQ